MCVYEGVYNLIKGDKKKFNIRFGRYKKPTSNKSHKTHRGKEEKEKTFHKPNPSHLGERLHFEAFPHFRKQKEKKIKTKKICSFRI